MAISFCSNCGRDLTGLPATEPCPKCQQRRKAPGAALLTLDSIIKRIENGEQDPETILHLLNILKGEL